MAYKGDSANLHGGLLLISCARLSASLLLTAVCAATPLAAQQRRPRHHVTEAEVRAITRSAILIDTHNDVTSRTVNGYDIATPNTKAQTDLPRMKGYLGAEFFAVFVDASYVKDNHAAHRTLEMIDTVRHDIIARHPKDFLFATSADDILRAHRQHKIAGLMGIEGGHAIEDSLRLLRDYYALGVRYMTLTHFNTNDWADSQGDINDPKVAHHNGLTPFGKDVVREMNRLGMMVDISHVADKTFWDALETSSAPMIASHSSCRALTDYTRNMADEMIKALAAKGGVININFGCDFLSQTYWDKKKAIRPKMHEEFKKLRDIKDPEERDAKEDAIEEQLMAGTPRPTVADVAAHIDHAVQIAGIDHVGIGTDFDGVGPCVPKGVASYAEFPNLTRALLERGYTAVEIKKIYGGNMIAVMRKVETEARKLQAK
ncbi:MAG: dipeptidase [Acidobacteria bacterium]|nr:dipeptidase [Acidobacteriota bacterium]